ncbi:MAG: N-acetylglutaminylglutamine synthetase [Rhodocyclaceae bacterium]
MGHPQNDPPSDDDLMDPLRMSTLKNWGEPLEHAPTNAMKAEAAADCGWGRLIFGQTFEEPERLAETLRAEAPGQRDVGFYIRDPHVVIAQAPQSLFLDPSHTYRLALQAHPLEATAGDAWEVRPATPGDAAELERIYLTRQMVPLRAGFLDTLHPDGAVMLLVAAETGAAGAGRLLGAVTGVDHVVAFDDPDHGASLWSLAVDPQCPYPGIGAALVAALATHFRRCGRTYLDLSVMHDNTEAIALYERFGFARVPVYCVKHKNPINEKLYVGPDEAGELNIYARILVDEARRRGIAVEVIDAAHGYFRLTFGGRSIVCRESLSELTSAIAMSRCDDKRVTRKVLTGAGLSMPEQILAGHAPFDARDRAELAAFLDRHGSVVVKPARGEQGHGVAVDLRSLAGIERAVAAARQFCDDVVVEETVAGEDLRIIVIDYQVVAAATRRPAEIVGDGVHDIATLIDKQSRRRAAATAGESRIPMDAETERCIAAAGHGMGTVLPAGARLAVRKTANLHTGGTINDVTAQLHPTLREVAEHAARALDIPVTGLDFIVPDPAGPDYAIIEANERPGLANHEPQPTAERFIDLLFPQTRNAS